MTLASCFTCLGPAQTQAVQTYLLQQIAGDSHTPEELAELSKCFCFDPARMKAVQAYLLCQIANSGGGLATVYHGHSPNEWSTEVDFAGLQYSHAATDQFADYDFPILEYLAEDAYLYWLWPDSMGSPAVTTGFNIVGVPIGNVIIGGIASSGIYSNTENGWNYATVTLDGVLYRVYRTENKVASGQLWVITVE